VKEVAVKAVDGDVVGILVETLNCRAVGGGGCAVGCNEDFAGDYAVVETVGGI
jgi:hypothetical protein